MCGCDFSYVCPKCRGTEHDDQWMLLHSDDPQPQDRIYDAMYADDVPERKEWRVAA